MRMFAFVLLLLPLTARADEKHINACNAYGCYEDGGGCNEYGCWRSGGMCNEFGCSDYGTCTPYGCPRPPRRERPHRRPSTTTE